MSVLFIAGSGTDVGKTYVATQMIETARAAGRPVLALKPVASGCPPIEDPDFGATDTARLIAAQGGQATREAADACSPWRFRAPLSPDMAAAAEGRTIKLEAIARFVRASIDAAPPGALVLIEGVGGVMSPISEDALNLDLIARLDCFTLLVTGSYLGAISHTLTAIAALAALGARLGQVVVSASLESPVDLDATVGAIARFAPGLLIRGLPRGGALVWPQGL